MLYCPYCGAKIKEEELFCSNCGKKIPSDLTSRIIDEEKVNYRLWYIPLVLFIILIVSFVTYYLHLEGETKQAKDFFNQGEQYALEGKYQEALHSFASAIEANENFSSAKESKAFMEIVIQVNAETEEANDFLKEEHFQDALDTITSAENRLTGFNGELVDILQNKITLQRELIQLEQLKKQMVKEPSIEELKTLLWQAEAISNNDEASEIATNIREQIISYAFSTANEQLKMHQFLNARDIVADALKYAPNSVKLQSLKTTIEKEKIAFETEQQRRIEQAMSAAEEEREKNQNDAIKLININVTEDSQQNLVVAGELQSVATIPVNSTSVEYSLIDSENQEIITNEVFVYPDTLYPNETGKFEFTHYDIVEEKTDLKVKITKIKWFLD